MFKIGRGFGMVDLVVCDIGRGCYSLGDADRSIVFLGQGDNKERK